jgi:hypothetical protein
MKRIFDYRRPIDAFNQILEFRFEPEIRDRTAEKFQFESEDSGFAPVPSVASRVRAENGCEFALIYIQGSNLLMVLSEWGADRSKWIETFIKACPELTPHLLNEYPSPPSPYPPDAVIQKWLQRIGHGGTGGSK